MLSPTWGTFAPFVLYAWRRGAGVPLAVLLQCSGSVWTWSNARAVPGESGSHEGLCPTIPSGSGWRWCFPAFGFCMNLCSRAQGRRVGAALPLCPPWLRTGGGRSAAVAAHGERLLGQIPATDHVNRVPGCSPCRGETSGGEGGGYHSPPSRLRCSGARCGDHAWHGPCHHVWDT